MPRLLEVKGLRAFYGATQALFDLDFGLNKGEITALLGANGAGKTHLCGRLPDGAHHGSIVFDGEELSGCATES